MLRVLEITAILLVVQTCSSAANLARESYQRTAEILEIVKRIEDTINKEDRLREISDVIRMSTTIDKMSKKLDRVAAVLDGSRTPSFGRLSSSTDVAPMDNGEISGRLDEIGDRLDRMELSINKLESMISDADMQKLKDIDTRSSQLKDDMNKKLGKMMNVISSLYEMNKDMKKNIGGRSDQTSEVDNPATPQQSNSFVAEFLVENLDELERKIKEQFSIFTNEIRSEITGLKIVASTVSDQCGGSVDQDEDYFSSSLPATPQRSKNSKRRSSHAGGPLREKEGRSAGSSLEDLVQSLGRSTREIKEEIQQGMQAIDMKLSNLTNLPLRCEDQLEAAESILSPRVSREYLQAPEQSLQDVNDKKKETCSKNVKHIPSPKSCAELRKGGATCDGVYIIFLQNTRAMRVYCDMTTEGGGWTVLMRRGDFEDKMTSFHRNWLSYKNGFGDMEGEFWLGNDAIHALTNKEENVLRVRLEAFDGDDTNMTYSSIVVDGEAENYKLHLGSVIGKETPASNSLKYHNNHPFSTFDVKNDPFTQNCAATYKGGWWFNGCYFGFLTGEYFKPEAKRENWQGILWYDWKGNASLKGGLMMIRPKNFSLH